MMAASLIDLLLYRMAEYGRLLAGYALPFPAEVLRALEKINLDHIRDDRAQAFLKALQARRADIEVAENPDDLAMVLLSDKEFFNDIAIWAADAARWVKNPMQLIDGLINMAITANTITEIQNELGESGRFDDLKYRIYIGLSGEDDSDFTIS